MTYAPAKFEVAMSNGLGGDTFTSKYIIKYLPWIYNYHVIFAPAKLIFKLLCPTVKDEMHLQENTLFDLDRGVKITQDDAQYPLNHVTYSPAKL